MKSATYSGMIYVIDNGFRRLWFDRRGTLSLFRCLLLSLSLSLSNARENFEVEVETRMFQEVRLRVACFGVYSPRVALRSEESNEYT